MSGVEETSKEQLTEFFKQNFPFGKEGLNELIASFKIESIPRNTLILQSGQVEKKLKFVRTGLVREYYTDEQTERNINFFESGEFATDFLSFQSDNTTRKWQQCLTDVELLTLPKNQFNQLLETYQCGQFIVEKAFQNILQCLESKTYNRLTKKPEELYQYIMECHPSWIQHIPQYHLASFMSITPETLSRIRKRIS